MGVYTKNKGKYKIDKDPTVGKENQLSHGIILFDHILNLMAAFEV